MRLKPDFLFKNGKFWTGSAAAPSANFLSASGGRILEVGTLANPSENNSGVIVDLRGHFAMPGFIDAHTHFGMGGASLRQIDLRDSKSEKEMSARIKDFVKSHIAGKWLVGGNWDHENWKSRTLPSKELIDAFTSSTPVFLDRLDSHMALVNTRALQIAGITRDTPDPNGGVIVRDSNGEPTGIVKDSARELVAGMIPKPSEDECIFDLKRAMKHARSLGVTTVHDISPQRDLNAIRVLKRRGELTVRFYFVPPLSDYMSLVGQGIEAARGQVCDEWLNLGAVKAFADGSLGSGTAWFFEPYEDDKTNSGIATDLMSTGELEKLAIIADRNHIQLAIHAIGDKAVSSVLDLFEKIRHENPPWERRFRIEHAQHVREADFSRFKELDVIASVQPYHCIDDGRWAERVIGTRRARTTYAFRSFLAHRVALAFGTDWPVAPLNPLQGIYAAVTRATTDGKNPDGWIAEQKIGVEDALRSYTLGAAYACFCENDRGTLEEGKLADFVVLSRSPLETRPDEIKDIKVLMTVAGGKIIFADDDFSEYHERQTS